MGESKYAFYYFIAINIQCKSAQFKPAAGRRTEDATVKTHLSDPQENNFPAIVCPFPLDNVK